MNQDPQNPLNPAAAAAPTLAPAPNPDISATPSMPPAIDTPMTTPETPAVDPSAGSIAAPTIDPSLLQQAINDVPDEAAQTTPATPSAVGINNLGAASAPVETPSMEAPAMGNPSVDPMMNSAAPMGAAPEASPFMNAAPAADFSAPAEAPVADPNATPAFGAEAPKTTPSVAFNDPAGAPEQKKGFKKPAFLEGKKINPVFLIVGGGALIILALVLILAFAV